MIFRPTSVPRHNVPIGVRSVGHYRVQPAFRDRVKVKHFTQLYSSVKGTGAMILNGSEQRLPPGHVAFYFPGDKHQVYALDEPWQYRWFTMDGAFAPMAVKAFGLASEIYKVGALPPALFNQLEHAILDVSLRGEFNASAIAYKILSLVAGRTPRHDEDPLVKQSLTLIHDNWNRCDLGIEQIARKLGVHRSSFSRRFKERMGLAPIEYITRLRVQNAISMLQNSKEPIGQIAQMCGYTDQNYFSRIIRQTLGRTPRQMRKTRSDSSTAD